MPSEMAKKVAGTFVADPLYTVSAEVLRWATNECRDGSLKDSVVEFCKRQDEPLDPSLLIVEAVTPEHIVCMVPAKAYDYESPHTFLAEVRLKISPLTKSCTRC